MAKQKKIVLAWCIAGNQRNNVAQVPLLDLYAAIRMMALDLLALHELPQYLMFLRGPLVVGKSCKEQQ